MSKIKPAHAYAKEIFDGFGGISSSAALSCEGVTDLSNFRILSDGSLEKRCGWRVYATLPATVRGVWQGTLDGISYCFAVGGNTVYRIEGGATTALSTLETSEGRVTFVPYRNRLYLLDGNETYVLSKSASEFTVAAGYAPLFGQNWHPTDYGATNEPLNLFSPRLRIHYFNTTGSTVFNLPFFAKSIDRVWVDGTVVTDYGFTAPDDSFTLSTVGSYVEVSFTVAFESDTEDAIRKCTRAFAERLGGRDVLALYGAPVGQQLFCAAQVSESMLNSCTAAYADTDPLYIHADTCLTVGSADHPVTSLIRDHDRILAFHALGASSLVFSEESDTVECYEPLHGVGCTAVGCDVTLDGDAVILNESGILRLSSPTSDPDAFSFSRLSETPDALCNRDFAARAIVCADTAHSELWFRDSEESGGRVWVYQTVQKKWYHFDGIRAAFFCQVEGALGFAALETVCVFDDALNSDGGSTFTAYCQSGFLTFGYPEEVKRSLRLSLCANTYGNRVDLQIQSEQFTKATAVLGERKTQPELFDLRLSIGRFRFLRVRFSDSGASRSRFYRLALYANL